MRGKFGRVQRRERGPLDVDHSLVGRAAPFHLRQREELVGMRQQRLAKLVEEGCPLLGSGVGPGSRVECGPSGRDRAVDLSVTRVGSRGDHRLGSRTDVVVAAVLGLDPLAVDVDRVGVDQ